MWLGFSLIVTIVVCAAPAIRNRGGVPVIDTGLVMPALRSVSGIWLPAVSCLVAFWFPKRERRAALAQSVPKERYIGAILLTLCYLFYATLSVIWVTYVDTYTDLSADLPTGTSFPERLNEAVEYCLLISPLALAPLHWLTGGSQQ